MAPTTASPTVADLATQTNIITQTPLVDTKTSKVKVVMAPGLFAAPRVTCPLRIAVYYGGGAGKGNSDLLVKAAKRLKGANVIPITPEEVGT